VRAGHLDGARQTAALVDRQGGNMSKELSDQLSILGDRAEELVDGRCEMVGIIDEMELLREQCRRERQDRVSAEMDRDHWRQRAERAEQALLELRHAMRAGVCTVRHCGQPVFNGHHCVAGHIQIRR
jgi:hypothetical protein